MAKKASWKLAIGVAAVAALMIHHQQQAKTPCCSDCASGKPCADKAPAA